MLHSKLAPSPYPFHFNPPVLHSLEQVPETGRWRFMDISPKYESKFAQAAYAQLLAEFRGKILPTDHPITRHVRRVITGILDANNLGTLHSSEPHRQPSAEGDSWAEHPYRAARPQTVNATPESGGKEWNLLVVNDPKVVNAMAMFGSFPRRLRSPGMG